MKNNQSIDSERFFISSLFYIFRRVADSQRERNDSKSWEIFGRAAPISGPVFPTHLSLLGYLLRGGSGGTYKSLRTDTVIL